MSEHDNLFSPFTEDARPHARRPAIADQDRDQEQGTNDSTTSVSEFPSTAPNDRRYALTHENSACCADARQELERVKAAAAADIQSLQTESLAKTREIGKLKRELSEAVDEDSPEAQTVKALLDLWWREVKDADPRVKHDLKSTRAPKVKKALKRRGPDLCQKAILGVLHDDWAMGRVAKSGGKDFCDIAEHILLSDQTIEKFAKLYDEHNPDLEPESLERQFVRHVYGDDCELDYRPESREPRRPLPNPGVPIDKVLDALRARGCQVVTYPGQPDQWSVQCPAHDDRDPSLAVRRKPDGTVLLHCFAGCLTEDVLGVLDLDWRDLWDRAEYDHNARDYQPRTPTVPSHLRVAMRQLLDRDERQAAA